MLQSMGSQRVRHDSATEQHKIHQITQPPLLKKQTPRHSRLLPPPCERVLVSIFKMKTRDPPFLLLKYFWTSCKHFNYTKSYK